ncbi:MAG: DUF6242 domain-containing protein [Mediterranea sp.]|jgi:hypothetical protein|nr:DUF6242 domain-containing protein [Mediterranea sp.]
MRIKLLPSIASLLLVSAFTTSCLDNDQNVEYSKDATIRAFAIDTVGYGVTYKFTINQLGDPALIFNADSLPVGADTIIDRILVTTFTSASGIVTMKTKDGINDSLISFADSMDLRKPLTVTVWSTEAYAGISTIKKEYRIEVRVHKHDPDSLRWQKQDTGIDNGIDGPLRSIVYKGNNILTYAMVGGNLKLYTSSIDAPNAWTGEGQVTAGGNAVTTRVSSIVAYKDVLYATFEGNNQGYTSIDGLTWIPSALQNAVLFLAPIQEKATDGTMTDTRLSYLKQKDANTYLFATSADGTSEEYPDAKKESIDEWTFKTFPHAITSYTNFKRPNGTQGTILIGEAEISTTINDTNGDPVSIALPWAYSQETDPQGVVTSQWVPLQAGSTLSYCPELKNPTIIYYNEKFYLFGSGFQAAYTSQSGRDWKLDKKFGFPRHAWSGSLTEHDVVEFRGRQHFSVVENPDTRYLIFMFGKEHVSFVETLPDAPSTRLSLTHNYDHESEVWLTRLNQLWFDLANGVANN